MTIELWWRVEWRSTHKRTRWLVVFQGPYPDAHALYLKHAREQAALTQIRLVSPAGQVWKSHTMPGPASAS